MSTSRIVRWNTSSHIWELSTDFGSTWSALPLDGSILNQGTVDPARLGSGSSISTKYLRGDSSWQSLSIPSLPISLANGGTGVDLSASGGTTKVLAQNASHVISARDLVAADIPSLAASIITTGLLALARGGTHTDLSATGGTSKFLKQASVGSDITVVQPVAADLSDFEDWTDWTASSSPSGWSSFTSGRKQVWYSRIGKIVTVYFHIEGISNATTVGFTMPYTSKNINASCNYGGALMLTYDNSNYVATTGKLELPNNSTAAVCWTSNARAGWTASGTKIVEGTVTYPIA